MCVVAGTTATGERLLLLLCTHKDKCHPAFLMPLLLLLLLLLLLASNYLQGRRLRYVNKHQTGHLSCAYNFLLFVRSCRCPAFLRLLPIYFFKRKENC